MKVCQNIHHVPMSVFTTANDKDKVKQNYGRKAKIKENAAKE